MNPYYITKKGKSTADKALTVHFFSYFYYGMSYCFLIAALYWDLWGGCFRAADNYYIAGVIPSNFHYDNWFQSKFITVRRINALYIYTKFCQSTSTMSDPVVDYSHVRGWSLPRGLSRCHEKMLYHHKTNSTADKALIVHFFSIFLLWYELLFLHSCPILKSLGGLFRAADSYHIAGVIHSNFQYDDWC